MNQIKMSMVPERTALLAGHSNELHVLVRVQAPTAPADLENTRRPLNLALVIDRSGSMDGRPMVEAQRCAEYIVDQLGESDRLALVAYDNQVDTLLYAGPVSNKVAAKEAIASLYSRGMTALFDGWQAGAEQISGSGAGKDAISRVLLLSDGCANVGLTETSEIIPFCVEMAQAGVSTSTYGLGHHFNEDLMVAMAKAGEGQSYYGESAEDLMDPFQEEFSLLSATCARQLELALHPAEGVQANVLNDYTATGELRWRLPDLAWEGEAWAVVKVIVPADLTEQAAAAPHTLLSAELAYTVGDETPTPLTATLAMPAIGAEAFKVVAEDELVRARMQELRVAQLQRQIRDAALAQDWRRVDALLAEARAEAKTNAWLEESLESLRRYARNRDTMRLRKEAAFAAQKLGSRLAAAGEDIADYYVGVEASRPMYLRRKPEQGKRLDQNSPRRRR
jgi:Ca-activated chloride channel family protein